MSMEEDEAPARPAAPAEEAPAQPAEEAAPAAPEAEEKPEEEAEPETPEQVGEKLRRMGAELTLRCVLEGILAVVLLHFGLVAEGWTKKIHQSLFYPPPTEIKDFRQDWKDA